MGENSSFIFTVCVKSVSLYHFKLAYVVLHMAVKEFFETHFQKWIGLRSLVFDPCPKWRSTQRLMTLSKMEVHAMINDSKILNLWTNKSCIETIHSLLVSVFDKVSKSKLSRFTAEYSSCNLQNAIFLRKPKCAKMKGTSHIFFQNN